VGQNHMKLTLLPKQEVLRIILIVVTIEFLIFLAPTTGKVEGLAHGYWDGVRLRVSSGNYWTRALLGGVGFGIMLAVLVAFSSYLTRFMKPPSNGNRDAGPDRRSSV
jgi:hypothetical protein